MPVQIWWIRRDLRIMNNAALQAAGKEGVPVVPVYILDARLMQSAGERRKQFLLAGLQDLRHQLRQSGSDLVVRQGKPQEELRKLLSETRAKKIFAEEDYSPYARKRDESIRHSLPLVLVLGLTAVNPSEMVTPQNRPYTVFYLFQRKWMAFPFLQINTTIPVEFVPAKSLPSSVPLPESRGVPGFPAGTEEAEKRLRDFLENRITAYAGQHDRMDLDGTSGLSPYIRFGMLSIGQIAASLRATGVEERGTAAWLRELIWREFYQSILYHFPQVKDANFHPKYRRIAWRNAPADLQAWKDGRTGYPVVDAAMRQLSSTGWMHNRARMIAASFLVKDLLIDWRVGERWFMEQLVDGDLASNNGGWQWIAGTGTDAAPYFRIFNPVLQSRKFDPAGAYIRKWVPEISQLPDEWLHEPWKMPEDRLWNYGVIPGKTYPVPIVDHSLARDRALAAYKATLREWVD
ncbi:MAG: deoxyribodipyrimidine photo-lyase [Leptolinea sp.]|jgi:deoxyribodipyrimidine photo-lyase|nr:deoxyribodipyrimidine photo-lyase [Leptolinea sp.]